MFLEHVRSFLSQAGIFLLSFLTTYTIGWILIVFTRLTWKRFLSEAGTVFSLRLLVLNDDTSSVLVLIGIIIACLSVRGFRRKSSGSSR